MKNAVISLLINVLTLALATICLISLLPLLGRAEPERSEKID
jgi:NADH:ubiquinone oxidoreductase subunit 3 (subunit A)